MCLISFLLGEPHASMQFFFPECTINIIILRDDCVQQFSSALCFQGDLIFIHNFFSYIYIIYILENFTGESPYIHCRSKRTQNICIHHSGLRDPFLFIYFILRRNSIPAHLHTKPLNLTCGKTRRCSHEE